jgi:hypothetical protein
MTREVNTSAVVEAGNRTAQYHVAVERMLAAILNEVAHADLWDAHHDVRRLDPGKGTGPTEVSPRYSVRAKRRWRAEKR